jgi:hypothetical protein
MKIVVEEDASERNEFQYRMVRAKEGNGGQPKNGECKDIVAARAGWALA